MSSDLPSLVSGTPNLPAKPNASGDKLVPAEVAVSGDITEQQKQYLKDAMYQASIGGAETAAMACKGEGCPYISKCWLKKQAITLPVGQDCPIETALVKTWMSAYIREMDVREDDPMNFFDATVAQSMAGLRLVINRAMWGMADNPILQQVFETEGKLGTIKTISGNLNADYLLKAIERIQKLGSEALMSRKQKAALLKGGYKDKSKQSANLQEKVKQHIAQNMKTLEVDVDGVPIKLSQIHVSSPPPKQE